MDRSNPSFQVDDYIILTGPYRGIPEGSVGVITAVEDTMPRRYHVYFGDSLPHDAIPENRLAKLNRRVRPMQ